MVDRLAMAKQYVQEMLEKRDDIVAAFVVGSVARGDATEASDIDLAFIVESGAVGETEIGGAIERGGGVERGGIDTWRQGVYIEAALAPAEQYGDIEAVLSDRISATHMNDALILYDPHGTFTRVQEGVRDVFMEPRWVGMRVWPVLRSLQEAVARLETAVMDGDPLAVCEHAAETTGGLIKAPLLIRGVTPSSTRGLILLERIMPDLTDRICHWQGSAALTAEESQAFMRIWDQFTSLAEGKYPAAWGGLPGYLQGKMRWLVANGQHHDAVRRIWGGPGWAVFLAGIAEEPGLVGIARSLARDLCLAAGWEGQDVLEEKVRIAQETVAEVEAMAAHLPVPEPAAEGHDG